MSKKVDLEAALRVIEAAKDKAHEFGVAMNIAVVDEGNNLVAFQRMNGAWLACTNLAIDKAYTSRGFNMETRELASLCQPGQPLYGMNSANDGRIIIYPGGVPIKDGETVVGAIGISGGTIKQGQAVAEAGVAAF